MGRSLVVSCGIANSRHFIANGIDVGGLQRVTDTALCILIELRT